MRYLVGWLIGTLALIFWWAHTPHAEAQSAPVIPGPSSVQICAEIAANPTTDNVLDMGLKMIADGETAQEAGERIGQSVRDICPRYTPLMMELLKEYGQ